MKEQKSVRNRLFKTEKVELESQKVELADINTLKADIKKVASSLKEGDKANDRLKKLQRDSKSLSQEFTKFSNDYKQGIGLPTNLYTSIKEIISKGKDLGIDLSNDRNVKEAELTMDAWEESRKEVIKFSQYAASMAKKLS